MTPEILKGKGGWKSAKIVIIRQEYLPFGNLEDQHRNSSFPLNEAAVLLCQALEGLIYLHSEGISHRDIKPRNILVRSRPPFSIKLADFGLARMSENGSLLQTFCGIRLYAAPEVWQPSYTSAVDIWSLGVVIYRFVHGLPTVEHGWDPQRWYQKLVQTINQRNSEELIDLATSGMVKIDPRERLPRMSV